MAPVGPQLQLRGMPPSFESVPCATDRKLHSGNIISLLLDDACVHRDLKPANIFVIKQSGVDVVKVVDFGIATQTANTPGSARLTAPGMVLGTAEYMAPEQAQGLPVDERLDQYALGCIMWE